ncbi:MAG: NADH-quinone oxidoreductase subunit NuoN [Thiothrix sp.]|nr:MAG: NADH-quinone oxidoreductase subunit NuoN [Thiothrix sp.]
MMAAFEIARPEIFLLAALCVVLLLDLFLGKQSRVITYLATQASLLTTILLVYSSFFNRPDKTVGLDGMYMVDEMAGVLKIAILLISILAFACARKYLRDQDMWRGEFFVLGMTAILGMLIMVSGYHLLVLYLGLELLSLSLYTLVAMRRDDAQATEAAIKYFVLGAVASGFLLYGMSMLYGISGSLELNTIREYFTNQPDIATNLPLMFALTFIVAGLAFKLGVVPFHMWLPDVYQGTPTAVTLFLSSAPKIAVFALVIRLMAEALEPAQSAWSQMIILLALLSIGIGNVVALVQTNLKRLFAYSAIAHMGFMLMGVVMNTHEGHSAAMFYILLYALMSAGTFAMLILLGRKGYEVTQLEDLKGLSGRHPWFALMFLLMLFSMAGIPPTAGFYAKFAVIESVIQAKFIWSAVFMVVMSVVGAFYYLRIIKIMYFDKPNDQPPIEADMDIRVLVSANGLLMILLGIFPSVLMEICDLALIASRL